jgi:hypothetical protein
MSLQKSLRLYFRRLERLAVAQGEEQLNAQEEFEFAIPGSQRFDPLFFPGFLEDPKDVSAD